MTIKEKECLDFLMVNAKAFLINGGIKENDELMEEYYESIQILNTVLEVIEIIKFGCTGLKYNSNGGSVIKMGNINAMDFDKLGNILTEICDRSNE